MPPPTRSVPADSVVLLLPEGTAVVAGQYVVDLRPLGEAGVGAFFDFEQAAPANPWVLNHGFGRLPRSVVVRDVNGRVILAAPEDPDVNTTLVHFAQPTAGTARLT